MPFPEAPRVIYEHNPLQLVLCEFRFPPILRIDTEVPSQFQERIRAIFPFYEPKPPFNLSGGLPPDFASAISHSFQLGGSAKAHDFIDKTKDWTVTLIRDKLTLSCRRYERWEQFKQRLVAPLEALKDIYAPPFYMRIGLRYRDVINRAELKLAEVPWKDLLESWIAGPYSSGDVESDIERAAHQILIRLPANDAHVVVSHGLILEMPKNHLSYAIDSDFFQDGPTEHSDVNARLEFFHQHAGRLFRWCIKDRLHEAMGPRPVPGA